jgi:hypothetical protein
MPRLFVCHPLRLGQLFFLGLLYLGLLLSASEAELARAEFPGWQGLRVVEQKGKPTLLRAADLDGDGRETLIVVNSRSSRLDLYTWRPAPTEQPDELLDASRPNELPFAPDFEHQELQLENIPRAVVVHDVDGDGQVELVVLVSSPNQVLVYHRLATGNWEKRFRIDLLEGDIASRMDALLLRELPAGELQLLVSMDNGIQLLELKPGGRAEWMTPREQRGRLHWWLADLDSDGQLDLVEQTRDSSESLRWYRAGASGGLAPAAVLLDRSVKDVEVMRPASTAQVVVLDPSASHLVRRYQLEAGQESPFGRQFPLSLGDGKQSVWCGLWQGEQRALVVADSQAPRLLSYHLSAEGWSPEQAYPALTDVKAIAPLTAARGSLLLWTKEGADLRKCHWEAGRMTYPKPWPQSSEVADREILALRSVGPWTWWVQRVGKDLDFYLADAQTATPAPLRFLKVGAKVDEVLWIGGQRLLIKETHGRALKLLDLQGQEVQVRSPAHLKKASLSEFKLFAVGDQLRLGRLTDGVLQWLDDDLQSQEQVMLPQGETLADYVMESASAGWALQSDSPYVHRIEIDRSRLSKSVERVKLSEGTGLLQDPVLGMLLLGRDRVTQLRAGPLQELKLVEVLDDRVGRAGGVKKTRFHRLGVTDIDRDGRDDLLLYDELQHRLTVCGEAQGALVPKISWPVFDDKVYPYGDDSDSLVKEPRAVLAADFDGDRQQDLALLSQDRLVIYLAREQE